MSWVMRSATECQHVAVLSKKGKKKSYKNGKGAFFFFGSDEHVVLCSSLMNIYCEALSIIISHSLFCYILQSTEMESLKEQET